MTERATGGTALKSVTLTFEQRCRSRLRAPLDDGGEVGLVLPRGQVLADGDLLRANDGTVIVVRAAPESVSIATTSDGLLLARAAYHLGNRHVPLQVEATRLVYRHDHVLDDLVRQLGIDVAYGRAPFHPEAGAYGDGKHAHTHGHAHAEGRIHEQGSHGDAAPHAHDDDGHTHEPH